MRAHTLVTVLSIATLLTGVAAAVHAQSAGAARPAVADGTIPYFDLGQSPLLLHGDARPNVCLASAGRRSIAMGTEDGRFELWSWPIKWAHDVQLSFRVPKYAAAIPARDVARSVDVRPEGVTISYAYETFTVRQHVFFRSRRAVGRSTPCSDPRRSRRPRTSRPISSRRRLRNL